MSKLIGCLDSLSAKPRGISLNFKIILILIFTAALLVIFYPKSEPEKVESINVPDAHDLAAPRYVANGGVLATEVADRSVAQAIADRKQIAELRRRVASAASSVYPDIEERRAYLTSLSPTGRLSSGSTDALNAEAAKRRSGDIAALQAIDTNARGVASKRLGRANDRDVATAAAARETKQQAADKAQIAELRRRVASGVYPDIEARRAEYAALAGDRGIPPYMLDILDKQRTARRASDLAALQAIDTHNDQVGTLAKENRANDDGFSEYEESLSNFCDVDISDIEARRARLLARPGPNQGYLPPIVEDSFNKEIAERLVVGCGNCTVGLSNFLSDLDAERARLTELGRGGLQPITAKLLNEVLQCLENSKALAHHD